MRIIDSCITQLKAQGPSRTCNQSQEEEEEEGLGMGRRPPALEVAIGQDLRHCAHNQPDIILMG